MISDAQLLQRYVDEGSEAAFAQLVERYANFVYGAALRMTRVPHRAEEVTQSVFVVLARKSRSLIARTDLAGWLHVATTHAARDLARAQMR